MEIKRKLMTNAQIAETEINIADQVRDVYHENKPRFESLGYELDLRFEYITDDDYNYSVLSFDEESKYPIGYVSRATLTVKRPKSDSEESEPEPPSEETDKALPEEEPAETQSGEVSGISSDEREAQATEEDEEQAKADRTLKISDEELKRTVAFAQVMLIRVYKTFWIEKISKTDDMDQLKEDLDEFYDRLSQKASE